MTKSYEDEMRTYSSTPFDSSAGRAEDCSVVSIVILRSLVRFRLEGEKQFFVTLALTMKRDKNVVKNIYLHF